MSTTPVAVVVSLDTRNLTAALTRAVDAATNALIVALRAKVAELERDYDSLRVEWDQVTIQRDDAWRTIARLTLDAGEHVPAEPAPGAHMADGMSWHDAADCDPTECPTFSVRLAWDQQPVTGITGNDGTQP